MNSKYLLSMEIKLEILIQIIKIYSEDIRMELDMEKCAVLIIKKGKEKQQK